MTPDTRAMVRPVTSYDIKHGQYTCASIHVGVVQAVIRSRLTSVLTAIWPYVKICGVTRHGAIYRAVPFLYLPPPLPIFFF